MAGTVRGYLTPAAIGWLKRTSANRLCCFRSSAIRRVRRKRRLLLSDNGLSTLLMSGARGLTVKHLDLMPRNTVKCRELYRYSLRLNAANDRLFRQRMRLSVFLQDNCQGVSTVRPGNSSPNGGYKGQWTPDETEAHRELSVAKDYTSASI